MKGLPITSDSARTGASKRAWPFEKNEQNEHRSTPTLSIPQGFLRAGETSSLEVNRNTCFGSVKLYLSLYGRILLLTVVQVIDVKAQLHSVDWLDRYDSGTTGSAQYLAVVQEGNYFALEFDGHKFAHLNKGLSRALRAVVTARQIRIQAYVSKKDWTIGVQSWPGKASALFPVEINLYGTRSDAEEVGRILSKSGIFLQFPQYGLNGVEYHNPHLLRMEGYSEQIPIETLPSPMEDVVKTPDLIEEDTQIDDFISILDSLSYLAILLPDMPVDHYIKTALLP
jgi:SWI/SNF-related matrix-associated actin-dependent regulator of chromatin subfamily A3